MSNYHEYQVEIIQSILYEPFLDLVIKFVLKYIHILYCSD